MLGKKNNILIFTISVVFFLQAAFCSTVYSSEWFEIRPNMSDEDFFGVWNGHEWTNPGKLNYDYSPGLAGVEACVKMGDYAGAQRELLEYYKNKKWDLNPSTSTSADIANLAANQFFIYSTECINSFVMNKSNGWHYVTADVTKQADKKSLMGIILVPLLKDTGNIRFKSKEADGGAYMPRIDLLINDEFMTFYAKGDGYIQAGARDKSFTTSEELLARESGLPIDDNSKRIYITFDLSSLPVDSTVTQATLKLYGKVDEGCLLEENIVYIFDDGQPGWLEETVLPDGTLQKSELTWQNYVTGVFSWQGCEPDELMWEHGTYTDDTEFSNQQLGRLGWMSALTSQYLKTGEEYYAENAIRLFLSFFYHKGLVKIWPERGQPGGYPRSLDTARRSSSLVNNLPHLIKSSAMKKEYFTELLKNGWYMGNFLLAEGAVWTKDDVPIRAQAAYHPTDNWGVTEKTSLLNIAAYFPEFSDSEKWAVNAVECLQELIMDLVMLPDGNYVEATQSYTGDRINDFLEIAKFAETNPALGDGLKKQLSNLCNTYIDWLTPAGLGNMWGDSDRPATAKTMNSTLYRAADFLADEGLLYYLTNGKEGSPPRRETTALDSETLAGAGPLPIGYPVENSDLTFTSRYHPYKKIAAQRSGWLNHDSYLFVSIDGGSGAHAHPDDLAVIVAAYGKTLLTDAGRFSYVESNPISNYARRQTISHNTVTINNTAQRTDIDGGIKANNKVSYFTTNDKFDFFEGTTSSYMENMGVKHTRSIAFVRPAYWIVTDKLEPENPETVFAYDQVWRASVDFELLCDENGKGYGGKTTYPDGINIQAVGVPDDDVTPVIVDKGYYSPNMNIAKEIKYISFKQKKAGAVYYNTILYPNKATDLTKVTAEGLDTLYPDASRAFKINFTNDGGHTEDIYFISLLDENQTRPAESFDRYRFNGKTAHIQRNSLYETSVASIVNGTTLEDDGTAIISSEDTLTDFSVEWVTCAIEMSTSMDLAKLNAPVRIYAPKELRWVTLNGKDIRYEREGDYIVIGK